MRKIDGYKTTLTDQQLIDASYKGTLYLDKGLNQIDTLGRWRYRFGMFSPYLKDLIPVELNGEDHIVKKI
jgi:hypothetical protein